jgi:peptidoglycan hydrolase-like protein with peptidoglycan-binding domain
MINLRAVISGGVGNGGKNVPGDVRLVQRLLNDALGKKGHTLLKVDGIVGPKTRSAIENYQKSHSLFTDGRVDQGGPTLKCLIEEHYSSLVAGLIGLPCASTMSKPAEDYADLVLSVFQGHLSKLKT